jgi:hypothetical protein
MNIVIEIEKKIKKGQVVLFTLNCFALIDATDTHWIFIMPDINHRFSFGLTNTPPNLELTLPYKVYDYNDYYSSSLVQR